MATETIKVYIHKDKHSAKLMPFCIDMSEYGHILIGTHEFEYEIPADFNPVAAEVALLEKQLDKINDEHMRQVKQIKGRIADLQCLPAPEPKASSTIDFSADEVKF